MGEIILVRHGQANSGATTEDEYDHLSPLGTRQGEALGTYLRSVGLTFDLAVHGSLRRHKSTLAAMGDLAPEVREDARLNELDYLTLAKVLDEKHGIAQANPEDFLDHFTEVLHHWEADKIRGQESFNNFQDRVKGVLETARQPGKRVLCVTSGGVIAMAMRHLMGLDLRATAKAALPIYNTSLSAVAVRSDGQMIFSGFNAIPHLMAPEQADLRTFY